MNNSKKKDEITCVQLSKETRDKLADIGKKDDTFEDIIKGLIKNTSVYRPNEPKSPHEEGEDEYE